MVVGTDLGNVNKQRQGTGLATVLTGADKPVDDLQKYYMLDYANKQNKMEERNKERDAALKNLRDFNPEYWYQHDKEMKDATQAVVQRGVDLMQKGVNNPFAATDPDSQEFQKQYLRVQQMAKSSLQIKDEDGKILNELQGKGPDYWDDHSIIEYERYRKQSLAEKLDNPMAPPVLVQKRPLKNLSEYYNTFMTAVAEKHNGQPLTPQEKADVVKSALADPSKAGQELVATHQAAIASLNKDEQKALEKRAEGNGRTIVEQHAIEYADRWEKKQKPLDFWGDFDKGFSNYTPSYTAGSNEKGSWSTPDWNSTIPRLRQDLRNFFLSDDRALAYYAETQLPRNPSMSDKEYLESAVNDMLPKAKAMVLTQKRFEKKTDGDAKEKEAYNLWIDHMKSGDPQLAQNAAGFLIGNNAYANLSITDAKVHTQEFLTTTWPDVMAGEKIVPGDKKMFLTLTLKTPLGVKASKEEIKSQMGIPDDAEQKGIANIVETQGQDIITIDLSKWSPTEGALNRLYRSGNKTYEAPKFLDALPQSLQGAAPEQKQQPAAATETFDITKFK